MITDMDGKEIKIGYMVKKFSTINDKKSSYRVARVEHISPMHGGGDVMIWAGAGGAHHPKACLVVAININSEQN